jgi:hypothetical protein
MGPKAFRTLQNETPDKIAPSLAFDAAGAEAAGKIALQKCEE